jgi:hypothetical protein
LAGDVRTRSAMESMSLDELLVRIKTELAKLRPIIDLEAIWEPQGSRTERGLSKSVPPLVVQELEPAGRPFPACVAAAETTGAFGSGVSDAWAARAQWLARR